MKPETELAQLVVDWSKIDDKVAEQGWDGGERDGEWENCKNAMVAVAQDILEGEYKPKTEDIELKIVHKYGHEGIIGIGVSVHPASKVKEGFVSVRMIPSESCAIRPQALGPICLFFNDLSRIVSVFDGIEDGTEISRSHETLPITRQFSVFHCIEESPSYHGYGFRFVLSTAFGPIEGDNWIEHAEFGIDVNEAVGLREVLRHAMLLVGCGLPANMRKAGE
jgi:hypothetical protein